LFVTITDFAVTGAVADVTANSLSIVFPTGETSVDLTFSASTDNEVEGDEFVLFTIVNSTEYTVGQEDELELSITDMNCNLLSAYV